MIQLTRLNHSPLVVNSDWIKFIETAPDTVITLLTGEKVVVLETIEQVVERVVEFRRRIHDARAAENAASLQAAQVAKFGDAGEVS